MIDDGGSQGVPRVATDTVNYRTPGEGGGASCYDSTQPLLWLRNRTTFYDATLRRIAPTFSEEHLRVQEGSRVPCRMVFSPI
jgi:hypothetical protein